MEELKERLRLRKAFRDGPYLMVAYKIRLSMNTRIPMADGSVQAVEQRSRSSSFPGRSSIRGGFARIPNRLKQLFVDAAEAAVAHDEYVVARLSNGRDRPDQGFQLV